MINEDSLWRVLVFLVLLLVTATICLSQSVLGDL